MWDQWFKFYYKDKNSGIKVHICYFNYLLTLFVESQNMQWPYSILYKYVFEINPVIKILNILYIFLIKNIGNAFLCLI